MQSKFKTYLIISKRMKAGAINIANITGVFLLVLIVPIIGQYSNCGLSDTLRGCIDCSSPTYFLTMNITSQLFTCTLLQNCAIVDNEGDNCTTCLNGYALNSDSNTSISSCIQKLGCKSMQDSICTECISSGFYLNTTSDDCQPILIDYCWEINLSMCTQCSDQNIVASSNCSIGSSLCSSFNYITWSCQQCPNQTVLHSSGIFCYTEDQNCLIYSVNGCRLCKERYDYNETSQVCEQGITSNLQAELIAANHKFLASNINEKIRFCLNNSQYFDQITNLCTLTSSTVNNCLDSTGTLCNRCLQKFYLYQGACKSCRVYDNCWKCDQYNCLLCSPEYYLVITDKSSTIDDIYTGLSASITKCLPCTIYGCLYCRTQFNLNGIDSIYCDECLFGYKLYNHTCYSCPSGTYFSIPLKQCVNCTQQNCQFCNENATLCEQCTGIAYFAANSCKNSLANSIILSNINDIYQILNKSMLYSSRFINNNQKLLITSCEGDSNGYACLCTPSGNITYSSLCYGINVNLVNANLSAITSSITSFTLVSFVKYLKEIKLLSELPSFNNLYQPTANQLLSLNEFAMYLQVLTNLVRNGYQTTRISSMSNWVFATQYKAFDPQNSTIFSGPGFYFKYSPKNVLSDDANFVTISQKVADTIVLVLFNSSTNLATKKITGNIYTIVNRIVPLPVTITIKKVNFLQNNQQYTILDRNGDLQNLKISSNSDGYLIIQDYSIAALNVTKPFSYIFVSSTSNSLIQDRYFNQRIENIIYRDAFIYILIVVALYLIFIPLCAVTDCVDNQSSKRVVQKSEEERSSYEGIKRQNQTEREEEVVLKINYRDFFPIYNIANTPRPKRFVKICLFIVNCQHSVTMITLIYFKLPAGQPIVAILLAIPAYICTIILGYICGTVVIHLPGYAKYLINLVSLGYWIIWVAAMSSFTSSEYKPYVFIFTVIFLLIDMIIDFLETLLMYFTIKQQEKQIKLFRVLSKFLSYRGYYQFDAMARQINDIRNTE